MKHSYAKDVLLSFALQIFENGRSFLLIPVIAKTIGASGYGIWVQVKIGIAFLCPFLLLGSGSGISRFLPGSSRKEIQDGMYSSFAVAIITGTGFALLIFLSEGIIEKYIESIPNSGLFIKGLALLCIAEPLNNLSLEYYRVFRKMKTLLSLSIFDTIFEFAPVFYFAYYGFGISVVIFSFACGRLFMAVVKVLSLFWEVGFGSLKIDTIVNFIKFGFPLIWANIFFYISNYLDRYLIGYFHSAKEVGIYSLAYTVGYTVVLISAPWDRVLIPTITEHWNRGNVTEASNYFKDTLRYVLIIAIPLTVFLSAVGREIVEILSTPEFLNAIYIIPVMLIAFFMFEIGIFYHRLVMLTHNSITITKVFGIVAVISMVLNLILIPQFSISGAAVSLSVTYGILFLIFYKFATVKINTITFDWLLVIKCLAATIPGSLILLLNKGEIHNLFLNIAIAISLYFAILWILDIIGKREWTFMREFLYVPKKKV